MITLLVSTKQLEEVFCNTMVDKLMPGLTDFNAAQLNLLIAKHFRSYCLFVAQEVCQYVKQENNSYLDSEMFYLESRYKRDFEIFISTFLLWMKQDIDEYLDWLKNILRNIFMKQLIDLTGVDVYDSRKYEFRKCEHFREGSSSSERILLIEIETR